MSIEVFSEFDTVKENIREFFKGKTKNMQKWGSVRRIFLGISFLVLVFFSNQASAQWGPDPIRITEDTTWTKETPNLIFDTKILVENNATLKIEKGTRIVFRVNEEYPFTAPGIQVLRGAILASGTKEEPITLTSSEDGFSLYFNDTNQTSLLRFVTLENGGFIPSSFEEGGDLVPHIPVINVEGGKLRMENSQFIHSRTDEIRAFDSTAYDVNGNPIVDEEGNFLQDRIQVDVLNSNFSFSPAVDSGLDCLVYASEEDEEGHIDQECAKRITLKDNWYGNLSGPTTDEDAENGDIKGYRILGTHFLDSWRTTSEIPDMSTPPQKCTEQCFSNVMFLPGFEASRLYTDGLLGTENQLWEPNRNGDAEKLHLDEEGKSMDANVYTKEVIDEVNLSPVGQSNIYKSFLSDLEEWKSKEGLIADYAAVPYDWRLSMEDLLEGGDVSAGDHIFYTRKSSDPYVVKTLRDLAKTSKSGKVTIVAHSNGGLVAKALVNTLGAEAEGLIDAIVFVATPQSGTPQAIGGLLHGFDQGIPADWMPFFLSPKNARILARNMPGAYPLLPSSAYFKGQGGETSTPVITFRDGTLTKDWIDTYGHEVIGSEELDTFLKDGEKKVPSDSEELGSPSSVNEHLLEYAENTHQTLDEQWTAPASIALYQIAGFGEETLSSIEYWTGNVCVRTFRGWCLEYQEKIQYTPKMVVDGDGTVVAPSALAMHTAGRYWVDLDDYNIPLIRSIGHADILEIPQLRDFLKNNILTKSTTDLPDYISVSKPSYDASAKRLEYVLHSPLTLSVRDTSGNETNSLSSTIPGARYKRFGEVQYLSLPADVPHTVLLKGLSEGSFTLEVREMAGDRAVAITAFAGIPTTPDTEVRMNNFGGTIESAESLVIDSDGDNHPDFTLKPKTNETVSLPPFDQTPPEAKIFFDAQTHTIAVEGIDETQTTVVYAVISPVEKKKKEDKKEEESTKTATLTDQAGNSIALTYKERSSDKDRKVYVEILSVRYNGVETMLNNTTLTYKWNIDEKDKKEHTYKKFVSFAETENASVESHYRPKEDITVFMTRPRESDDNDPDDNERPIKQKLPGMIVPGIKTNQGKASIYY